MEDGSVFVPVDNGSLLVVVEDGSEVAVVPEDGAVEAMFGVVVVSEVMLAERC